ncbi:hypothetical protein DFJ58DRAFT_836095 [Suillus subalutaceus]|uniref:uncharacterized protein n=1 Tax=Suillus subalutaceus TaxID=48586 RepID=UPI001B884023|nr:uncharacterized protein DFJ58DRAFT_836095 [Suillus subalutaceus]KAG1875470.1 hypothetical protein DFJ58DRAFT_836095 [Suillus subalutaceus]
MDQHLNFLPDPPSSPASPPDTPTPTHRKIAGPTPPTNPLVTQELKVTTPVKNLESNATQSDLSNSIHAPGNAIVDQAMSAPPSQPTMSTRTQTAEEGAILAHLALAEANRSVLSRDGINYRTILPQFTPTPVGGFPKVHMAHSAQIFDHLDNKVLLAWFQVEHPKFMVRVFDHSGKDVAEKPAIIAERLRAMHRLPEETANLIVNQCIWSSTDITFEALPFNCTHPPELLFCLSGFTTSNTDVVRKAVVDVWAHNNNRHHIDNTFSMCGFPNCSFPDEELVYKATREFIISVCIELLNFKITGGLSIPRFNILASSPTNDAKTWTDLCGFLHLLEYPTGLDGCGIAAALYPCQICHSLTHPRGLCPFPQVPLWNGPKLSARNATNSSHQSGRPRGGKNGRHT